MINIILPPDSTLYQSFEQLTASQRIVFFAGLPGVGKSLLLQQLALMAHQAGRKVHLLQWDVARQPFETDAYVLAHYPEVEGITHGVIRKAVGLWARATIGQWQQDHPAEGEMLIGEVPLIGHRLMELAQRHDDAVEPVLSSPATKFVIPVPSLELRRVIEGKREVSSTKPQHEREQADAIPQVLQALWRELYHVAPALGITGSVLGVEIDYDPDIYQGVYSKLLKHRHSHVLPLTTPLQTENLSAHDLTIQQTELTPTADEVRAYISEVERLYAGRDKALLEHEIDKWYIV
jgi:hypothetical protein